MKRRQILVSTALEKLWGDGTEHLIFLGEWCRLYDRKHIWEKRSYEVIPYHWSNREKLSNDHDYLKMLYEKVLCNLFQKLNIIHNIDRPELYWRIILGPWLFTQIAIFWDRWESIRIALDEFKIDEAQVYVFNKKTPAPFDYIEFASGFWNHYLNNELYRQILEYRQFAFIKTVKCDETLHWEKIKKSPSKNHKLLQIFDSLMAKLPNKEKVFFHNSYFDYLSLIRLSLTLGQVPRFPTFEYSSDVRYNESNVRNQELDISQNNDFENFLSKNILNAIPQIYLEAFLKERLNVRRNKTNAKIIFTANSHFAYELFKIWAAEQILIGKKLIISNHGGAIPPKYSMMNHESKIADKKIVWHKPIIDNHVQLSPNKLVFQRKVQKITKEKKYITIVGLDLGLYSYRCESGPNSSLILEDFDQKIRFTKGLDENLKAVLRIRPYPDRGWTLGQRYADELGADKISSEKTLRDAILKSKIVVCTYPQTTYMEAMHSGIPTILLYTEKYWELDNTFKDMVDYLKGSEMIFSNPLKAAELINRIAENPMSWWNDSVRNKAREYFFAMCGRMNENWLEEWTGFFNQEYSRC